MRNFSMMLVFFATDNWRHVLGLRNLLPFKSQASEQFTLRQRVYGGGESGIYS